MEQINKSSFQFSNPALTDLEYIINSGFLKNQETTTDVSFSVEISRNKSLKEAVVGLIIEIGKKDSTCPYYLRAKESASFRWTDDYEEDTLKALLSQNAPALLLSYLRPIIVNITASSPFEVFNIPFINFTDKK